MDADGVAEADNRSADDNLINYLSDEAPPDRRKSDANGQPQFAVQLFVIDLGARKRVHSAASANASDSAGCTRRLSTMSLTLRFAVTASAMTLISSAA